MSVFPPTAGRPLKESLATPERVFLDRRQVVAGLGLGSLSLERDTLPYNGYAEQVAGLYRGDEF